MSDRKRLEQALVAADAAGDVDAAKALAAELRRAPMSLTEETAQFDAARARNPIDPSLYNQRDIAKSKALELIRGNVRNVGLAGRTIMNAFTSLPLMAMDAGVGLRNLTTGSDYDIPSQTWRQGLNELGIPQHEGFTEKAADFVGQMAVGGKVIPTPQVKAPAPANFNTQTMKQMAAEAARQQGYVVPPSTVNPSAGNKVLESIGGKIAMEQDASLQNQQVTDALMKRALGLDEAAQVTDDTLAALRTKAGEAYKALRGIGTMRADAQYGRQLDDIAAQYQGAAKDFPELARADVLKAVEAVRKPSFDSDSAMDAIAILREKSSTAFAQGDKALGKAYREISGAMESAIERSLGRRGEDSAKLLANFREARQLIAKTYTAGKALNPQTGSFNATKLAGELAKGKPLTGEMKQVADFASAFPKASKLVLDSGPVRNTDVILGAGTAALSREPTYLLYPFLRQAVRAGLLSDAGQKALSQPGIQPTSLPALSLLYGGGLLSQ